jgi:TonB family protein
MKYRLIAILMLLCVAVCAFGQAAGPDEAKLKAQFEGKIISLHHFYAERFQRFDADGDTKEEFPTCSWTMCSKLEVDKVSISKNKLKVEGRRIWVLFKGEPRQISYARSPERMQVEIDLADGPERSKKLAAAFPKVFLVGQQKFEDDVPEFWRPVFDKKTEASTAVKPAEKEEAPTAKKEDAAPTPVAKKTPKRVRVSQGVTEGLLVKKVTPQYPETALWTKISGSVVMSALIEKNGDIGSLQVIKPVGAGLDEAAYDGVKKWKYQPYLINGQPVEVVTQITVNFQLRH